MKENVVRLGPALAREEYVKTLEKVIKGYRLLAGVCTQCGGKHAYPGAIYCGAGCTARSEAHEPIRFKDIEKE